MDTSPFEEDVEKYLQDLREAVLKVPSRQHGLNHWESDLGLETGLSGYAFPLWRLELGFWLQTRSFPLIKIQRGRK